MASKSALTTVTDSSTASKLLIAANPDRVGLMITNVSTGALAIRLTQTSTTAATTTTGHTWRLAANGGQINLSDFSGRCWKGAVTGIWFGAGSGSANITELE